MKKLTVQESYEVAENIGMFLVGKGLKVWGQWAGRMTKAEQMDAFGYYFGKGLIEVDGSQDYIVCVVKVAFGADSTTIRGVGAQSKTWFDEGNGSIGNQIEARRK